MNITYSQATKDDICDLIKLRLAYVDDDFGVVSHNEKKRMTNQLEDYFDRKLGDELIAFVAKDGDEMAAVVYLHIMEMPANANILNGLYGDVLNVYTCPKYRGHGLCTNLMNILIEYARRRGLERIDLKATDEGYSVYKNVGFSDNKHKYKIMSYKFK